MVTPTLFSAKLPTLQLAWDATSLRALMFCPRFYQYSILEGWRGDATDLEFGILAHAAMERYDKVIADGNTWEDAQRAAVTYALQASGSRGEDGQWTPWGGRYEPMWKCSGSEPYGKKGKGGGKLKCPYAHKGVWVPGHGPSLCGECGSPTVQEERWLPQKKGKDRPSLVRTVAWWCEELRGSPIRTLMLPDGKPAVEINFRVQLPWVYEHMEPNSDMESMFELSPGNSDLVPAAERFWLVGYYDGLASFGSENFVRERKTTGKDLGKGYWSGWTPNVQMDTYDLSARFIPEIAGMNIRGVVVEAAQSIATGSRFGWQILHRTEDQRDEHLETVRYWIGEAVKHATAGQWPMNKANCAVCPFKKVCSKERGKREMFLEADFKRQRWNPLEER